MDGVFNKNCMRKIIIRLVTNLPVKYRLILRYFISFGRFPKMRNPTSFNEKILIYKLNYTSLFTKCADKISVKEYVEQKVNSKYVIPTIYSGTSLPQREDRNWKLPFVIKTNNGSGTNIFVRNKEELDWNIIEKKLKIWLSKKYGEELGELHYTKITPKILIEPFISNSFELPLDYKVFVFNGKPHCIQVDTGREKNHKRAFFDTKWNKMNFTMGDYKIEKKLISQPNNFNEMLNIASRLGEDFPFVRVDFYEVNNALYFGEMTFFPGGGTERFLPQRFDNKFGKLW